MHVTSWLTAAAEVVGSDAFALFAIAAVVVGRVSNRKLLDTRFNT